MKQILSVRYFLIVMISLAIVIYSCSKGDGGGTAPNPCAGVTISVSATTSNPTISIATDGSITASASGSSGFTFSINGSPFQTSGVFSNLGVGSYTITAKNGSGCTGSSSFTLTAPNPCAGVTITVSGTTTNPTSAAASNGSIVATATGSTGFTFSLNSGAFQASGTFNNLAAGVYTVTAKNGAGCTGTANFTLTAPNVCSGVTITVSNTATGTIPCESNTGAITATATGGTAPYTYSVNSGAFQSANTFSGLAAGNYTVTAKDANGCTGVSASTAINSQAAGPLFDAVRTLVQNNCVPCHSAAVQNGGMNFSVDCNIVNNKDRIKARAVDANPSAMPQGGLLPAAERQKITDWINAGGKFTN